MNLKVSIILLALTPYAVFVLRLQISHLTVVNSSQKSKNKHKIHKIHNKHELPAFIAFNVPALARRRRPKYAPPSRNMPLWDNPPKILLVCFLASIFIHQ